MRLRPLAPARHLGLLGLMLLFAAVNGLATFTGFRAMMGGERLLYPLLFTIAVQGLILHAVHRLVRPGRAPGRPVWLAAYLAGALSSVILGYGFYFDLLSDESLARATMRSGAAEIVERLTVFERAYADLAAATERLAVRSRARAREEREVGGTCGGPKIVGPGPRMRLRERDAELFEGFAVHFTARAGAIATLIAETRGASEAFEPAERAAGEAALDRALAEAKALRADPRLAGWRDAVAARLARARDGFVDPETREPFGCSDPALEAELATLRKIALPAVPERRAAVYEATHAADVRRAFVLVTGLLTGDAAAAAEFDPALDGPALGFGLLVDLALLCLAFGDRERHATRAGSGLASVARRLSGDPDLPPDALDALAKVVDDGARHPVSRLLSEFGYAEGRRDYLLVPVDLATAPATSAERLAGLLLELGLAAPKGVLRLVRFPTWWRERRAALLAGSERVAVFHVKAGLARKLLLEDLLRRMKDTETVPVLEGEILPPESERLREAA